MNRRRSFRTHFVLAAIVCLLPLLAALFFVVDQSLDQARASFVETEIATTNVIARGVADTLTENEAVMSELATNDAIRALDVAESQEILVAYKRARPSLYSIFLVDTTGAVVASGGFDPSPVLPDITANLDRALTVAETSVSGRIVLPDGSLEAVAIIVPVWSDPSNTEGGTPIGAIGGLLSVDRLGRAFLPLSTIPGNSAVAVLTSGDASIVTVQSSAQLTTDVAEDLATPIAASLARVRTTLPYDDPREQDRIAVIVPVEHHAVAWSVIVSTVDPTMMGENQAFLQRVIAALATAIFLTLLLALVFAEVTARPVRRLTRHAIALAEGNYTQPMETIGSGEVAMLSDAFGEMAERLTAQFVDLENARAEVADQAERLRELLRRTVRLQEDERRRIASDIHDAVSPLITGSLYETRALQIARSGEGGTENSEDVEALGAIAKLLEQAMEELHRVIFDLRPPDLDDLGIDAAIERYVAQVNRSGLPCRFEVVGEAQRLSPEVRLGIYRIVQEALHNALRHAHADEAIVRIQWNDDALRVSVRDNGSGFDPDQAPPTTSLGLLSMRERAAAIGGELRIRSHAGEGTAIVLDRPHGPSLTGGVAVSGVSDELEPPPAVLALEETSR
jgi:signal transduction histidine kinase